MRNIMEMLGGLDSQLFDEALVASSNAIFKIIVLVVLGVIFTFQGKRNEWLR